MSDLDAALVGIATRCVLIVAGLVAIAWLIREHRRSERAFRKSQEEYARLAESMRELGQRARLAQWQIEESIRQYERMK